LVVGGVVVGVRRVVVGVVAAGLVAVGGLVGSARAATGVSVSRVFGSDRYGTAQAVAAQAFPAGATIAVVASGLSYPDALSAAYVAGRVRGPVVLTDPNSLSVPAQQALQSLGVTGVDVVGSAGASSSLVNELVGLGYQVTPIFGADRYGTAQKVDELFPASFVGSMDGNGPTAIVASGVNFPDALAAAPMSYQASFPLVLTDPNNLPAASVDVLHTDGIKQVLVVGGTAAVSDGVARQLASNGVVVTRVAGADRTQTAAELADQIELAKLGWSNQAAYLATGAGFADALAGAALAGQQAEPIVMAAGDSALGPYTTGWLTAHAPTLASITIFGGTAAIDDPTAQAALNAAQ
jgi:putative cell wall-binding protein